MAEFSDELRSAEDSTAKIKQNTEDIKENLEEASKAVKQLNGGAGGGGTEPNRSSGYNYQGMGGGGVGAGGGYGPNPYSGMGSQGAQQYTGMNFPGIPNVRTEKSKELFTGLFKGIGNVFASGAMALPEPNEALYTAMLGERLRFYGARDVGGKKIPGLFGNRGAFKLQEQFSGMGTPTSPLDAVMAANLGAGVGLLPGLPNFSKDLNKFGGILGGAAMASNLTPGLGLVGGIQAMSNLNQARRVNLLRMIGVSVRNIGGTQMKDLPEIIEQLYNILKHANGGANPTAEDIAISLQSGNALDSLLNQFFDDPNLRQVIISGLMQMVNTKGKSLREGARPAAMQKTGGSIAAVRSISKTDTTEMRLIQAYADKTLAGVQVGNEVLRGLYNTLISAANADKKTLVGGIVQEMTNLSVLLSAAETIGGARNGAGALFLKSLLGDKGEAGKLGLAFVGLEGVLGSITKYIGSSLFDNDKYTYESILEKIIGSTETDTIDINKLFGKDTNWNNTWLNNLSGYFTRYGPNPNSISAATYNSSAASAALPLFAPTPSSTPMQAASASASVKSGNIVINAYANTSTDPLVMGAALAKEITNQATMTGAMF